MAGLILCDNIEVKNPYYAGEIGIYLYSKEELSYYIYNDLLLLEEDFLNERLFSFIDQELKLTHLAEKLRKWNKKASEADLLYIILQDIRYCTNKDLVEFKKRAEQTAACSHVRRQKERADCLMRNNRCYRALQTYDNLLASADEEMKEDSLRGVIWYNRGSALAALSSMKEAMDSFVQAYTYLHQEDILEKIFVLHKLDESLEYPEEIQGHMTPELVQKLEAEYEEIHRHAIYEGKALEAAALKEKTPSERAAAYRSLMNQWKEDYRRNQ